MRWLIETLQRFPEITIFLSAGSAVKLIRSD